MYYSPSVSSVHGDSSGKVTGMGCHFLPQRIFLTQESNPCLRHCRWTLYPSHQEVQPKSYRTSYCFLVAFPFELCFLLSWFLRPIVVVPQSVLRQEVCFCHLWVHHQLLSTSEQRLTGHCQTVSAGWTPKETWLCAGLTISIKSIWNPSSLQLVARRPNLAHRCVFFSWSLHL